MHSHAVDDQVLYTCQRAAAQASHAVAAHAYVPLAIITAKAKVCWPWRQRGQVPSEGPLQEHAV